MKRYLSIGFLPIFSLVISLIANPAIASTLNAGLNGVADRLLYVAEGRVIQVSGEEIYVDIGAADNVRTGAQFQVIREGEAIVVNDETLGYTETVVGGIKINRVRENLSIGSVTESLAGNPQPADKVYEHSSGVKRVLVAQFDGNRGLNQYTKLLQEKLATILVDRGIQIVEREQLEKVLKEQKLGYSGLVDINSAQKIGQLLGAESMIVGTVNDEGNIISVNARLVSL